MQAAIIGDIYGSVYEAIPHIPLRTQAQPTDDSFLTAAAFEWMQLDALPALCTQPFSSELKEKLGAAAIDKMLHWFDAFPYENAFSPGFSTWVASQKKERTLIPSRQGHTNGILMRQSPIVALSYQHHLSYATMFKLIDCFGSLTHNHPEAQVASQTHAKMLWEAFENPAHMYEQLKNGHYGTIYPLSHWQQYSAFIYDAKRSLSIVLSLLTTAHSFEHFLQLAALIQKDADTYLAIGAPIASQLWSIPPDRIAWAMDILEQTPALQTVFMRM